MTRFWPLAALFSALAGLWGLFRLLTSGGHVHGILRRLWGLSFYLPIPYSLRLTVLRFIGYSFMVGTAAGRAAPTGAGPGRAVRRPSPVPGPPDPGRGRLPGRRDRRPRAADRGAGA